jgi:hypothetical protein
MYVDDRPNCGLDESLGTCVVAPKSERQTVTLDQKRSSLELRANIACEQCRFPHTSGPDKMDEG